MYFANQSFSHSLSCVIVFYVSIFFLLLWKMYYLIITSHTNSGPSPNNLTLVFAYGLRVARFRAATAGRVGSPKWGQWVSFMPNAEGASEFVNAVTSAQPVPYHPSESNSRPAVPLCIYFRTFIPGRGSVLGIVINLRSVVNLLIERFELKSWSEQNLLSRFLLHLWPLANLALMSTLFFLVIQT